jgi:hypothetical protein
MIDFNLFNWEEIFGTAVASEGMKRAQARGLRTEIIELSIAKHSSNQFKYVGMNDTLGHDFVTNDGIRWECKCKERMFNKTVPTTSDIILKNYAGKRIDVLDQKFDYMLLIDTVNMSVAYAPYNSVTKNMKINDANIITKVHYNDMEWVKLNVLPKKKRDVAEAIQTLIEEIV